MKFNHSKADLFLPQGESTEVAFKKVTHLGIGAHQDDLEFMAFHGILECFHSSEKWFAGITCTDGAGSAREGKYQDYTDAQMQVIRQEEQRTAAIIGKYAFMAQLGHPSSVAKSSTDTALRDDLERVFENCQPEVVYTHNLADKHETHIGVVIAVIEALRNQPADRHPQKVYGCEVWRDLDWLLDEEKVAFPVSAHENLAAALNGVFDSQIAGGKRYDLAIMGRRRANATFFDAHSVDESEQLAFGMDLTPLIQDTTQDVVDFTCSAIERFRQNVEDVLRKRLGR